MPAGPTECHLSLLQARTCRTRCLPGRWPDQFPPRCGSASPAPSTQASSGSRCGTSRAYPRRGSPIFGYVIRRSLLCLSGCVLFGCARMLGLSPPPFSSPRVGIAVIMVLCSAPLMPNCGSSLNSRMLRGFVTRMGQSVSQQPDELRLTAGRSSPALTFTPARQALGHFARRRGDAPVDRYARLLGSCRSRLRSAGAIRVSLRDRTGPRLGRPQHAAHSRSV